MSAIEIALINTDMLAKLLALLLIASAALAGPILFGHMTLSPGYYEFLYNDTCTTNGWVYFESFEIYEPINIAFIADPNRPMRFFKVQRLW